MDINKNILNTLKNKKLSQKELANSINVSASTLNNWLKLNRSIPSEYIIPICEFLKISPMLLLLNKESPPTKLTEDEQELLTYFNELDTLNKGKLIGKAELLVEIKKEKKKLKNITKTVLKQQEETEEKKVYIEFHESSASAGSGTYLFNNDSKIIKVRKTELTLKANFAVRINGDSMEPEFSNGDIVLVKTQPFIEPEEIGIFIINNEGYIKKLGGDKLISLNSKYKDVRFHEYDDIHCKGKVIGVLENDDILE